MENDLKFTVQHKFYSPVKYLGPCSTSYGSSSHGPTRGRERFAAGPGTASYGIPSVKAQYWSEVSIVGNVPPKVFFPAPNVDSVMLKFSRRLDPEKVDLELMWRLLKIGFGQRRKMLRKSLKGYIGIAEFNSAGLDPKSRPQDLTVNDWVSLAIAAANGEHSEN